MINANDIELSKKLFGEPGERSFGFFERLFYLRIKRPIWCDATDDLYTLFENKNNLINYGNIVWGCIVQANNSLFQKGYFNCPASVVFHPDPNAHPDLNDLSSAADKMFRLKGKSPDDEHLRKIANMLTDELERSFGIPVPKEFCSSYQLYEASTFISRKHLPNGILNKGVFPMLISHCSPYWCIPLPSKYWSKSMIDYWYS